MFTLLSCSFYFEKGSPGASRRAIRTFALDQPSRPAVPQSTIKLVNKKQILVGVVDNVLELFFFFLHSIIVALDNEYN